MSLRYKALIAVLALVALVTGGLGFYVSSLYRDAERSRIRRDLKRDAEQLNLQLQTTAQVTGAALKNSARSLDVVRLFADKGIDFKQNFEPLVASWRKGLRADFALAAVDSFEAEERKANILHRNEDLAVVALDARKPQTADRRTAMAADRALNELMRRCYVTASEKPGEDETSAEVLAIAGSCFLAVANPLFVSLQQHEVAGVACVLIELSSDWAVENHLGAAGVQDNRIEQIIFVGTAPTAQTVGDATTSARVLEAALASGSDFDVELELGGTRAAYVGRLSRFGLARSGTDNAPAFVAFKNLDRELEPLAALQRSVGFGGLALGLLGATVAYGGAWLVIRKLRRLQDATMKVRAGNFNTRVRIKGRDELGTLANAFNDMTTGLKALGVYTDDTLARKLMDRPELLVAGGRREEGSILFCDIKGFTPIAEKLSPEALVSQLNEYFTAMARHIKETRGYLDKFIGDAVMAYWGPPFGQEKDFASRACRAALLGQRAAAELREQWRQQGKPEFFLRVGIATGHVIVGNLGSDTKKNFTVIGNYVNLASRLEGANKLYGTEMLVDENTASGAGSEFLLREIDRIRVVGKQVPVRIFEVMGVASHTSAAVVRRCLAYGKALENYRTRNFADAAVQLKTLLERDPDDGAARWLLGMCERFAQSPPGSEWDAVTDADSK